MSEVKRYDPGCDYAGQDEMVESFDGAYVAYEDYAALKAKCDALVSEVVNIREQAEDVYAAGYNHGHLNTVDGIAYAPGIKDEFYPNALQVMLEAETPTTDAYLNSVRAEGVDFVAEAIGAKCSELKVDSEDWKALKSIVFLLGDFAAKLRAGEPS